MGKYHVNATEVQAGCHLPKQTNKTKCDNLRHVYKTKSKWRILKLRILTHFPFYEKVQGHHGIKMLYSFKSNGSRLKTLLWFYRQIGKVTRLCVVHSI